MVKRIAARYAKIACHAENTWCEHVNQKLAGKRGLRQHGAIHPGFATDELVEATLSGKLSGTGGAANGGDAELEDPGLIVREMLRWNPTIVDIIDKYWVKLSDRNFGASGSGGRIMTRDAFFALYSKVTVFLLPVTGDSSKLKRENGVSTADQVKINVLMPEWKTIKSSDKGELHIGKHLNL